MRKTGLFLPIVACLLVSACQKELDTNVLISGTGNSGGGSTNGDLLIKQYGRSGADSNVTTYSYNSAKQLIATYNVMSANGGATNYYGFERNAAGLIIRRKQYTTSGLSPIPADTSVTIYHYSSGATPQITYSISSIGISGFSVDDSTVYTYNAAGKLTKTDTYLSNILTGTIPGQRQVFTYDAAGNVTKVELFNLQSGIPVVLSTNTFTYDSKIASETLTEAEAIAITEQPAAMHNPTAYQASSTLVPLGISASYTYTYNTSNRPATSKQILTQGTANTETNIIFYYQ